MSKVQSPVYKGNFVKGDWRMPKTDSCFESINPATEEVIATCRMSGKQEVDEAVSSAHEAFQAWRRIPAPHRAEILYTFSDLLASRKEAIARTMTIEMGKVLAESRSELDATIAACRYMAGEGRRLFGETIPTSANERMAMTIREPIGVVACITPWNFPIALAAYKIFAALIAGNTVVWKPASNVALSACAFTELFALAGLPPGVLNLVLGSGSQVGEALVEHPDVKVISFTGSTAVGTRLAEKGSRTLKRVSLELGGKNGVIVLADADLDKAAEGIVQAAFTTAGQRCTAASRVIAEESIREELERRVVALSKSITVGNGMQPGVEMGPLATRSQLDTVERYAEIAKSQGGIVLTGGERLERAGYFYAPTVITNVRPTDRIAREEIFGPVLAILGAKNFEEAVAINNNTEYGLSSAIYTNSLHYAGRAMRELESGLVYINSGTSSSETGAPFGGMKMSGNGHREVSHHAFDSMTEWKTIYTNV